MPVLVGTSGWQYPHWRATFYPAGVPQARWLEHYAERFRTVEVNNTFYRLPEAAVFDDWRRRTPDDFLLAIKMSRFLTHMKKLKDPEEPMARFFDRAMHLGEKLGPVLVQLAPFMAADPGRLDAALALVPRGVRVAVEVRNDSWLSPETERVLARRGAALCFADRRGPLTPLWRTADFAYLRLHEGGAAPSPCYGDQALRTWARRLAAGWGERADVYVYFNNDARACAVRDAVRFAAASRAAGLSPTRVPALRDVALAA